MIWIVALAILWIAPLVGNWFLRHRAVKRTGPWILDRD
jgi:hypothetical protein